MGGICKRDADFLKVLSDNYSNSVNHEFAVVTNLVVESTASIRHILHKRATAPVLTPIGGVRKVATTNCICDLLKLMIRHFLNQ